MPLDQPLSADFLTSRTRILATELGAVRRARARCASGAHVHRLDNLITTITAAVHLAEKATIQDQPECLLLLLALADAGLHEARTLLFQAASCRYRHLSVVRDPARRNGR
jgi:hypothetical protein